jgi:tRNA threonylcarbamoyladenosine biosynthesis protein TsaB
LRVKTLKLLGIETSGKTASVAVCDGGVILSEINVLAGRDHSVMLLPLLKDCLRLAKTELSGLDGIAVSVGPGSYTGVRIGIAAAKGLAFGDGDKEGMPVCGVSALKAQAAEFFGPHETIVSVKKARGSLCYAAAYQNTHTILPDCVIETEAINEMFPNAYYVTDLPVRASAICKVAETMPFYNVRELKAAYLEATKAEKDLLL